VVRASDLRLNGRGFDPRPPHYRSVSIGMGDRLREGIPPRYVTSHPSQVSLLPSVGFASDVVIFVLKRDVKLQLTLCGTGNEYRLKCGDALQLEVKAGWLIPFVWVAGEFSRKVLSSSFSTNAPRYVNCRSDRRPLIPRETFTPHVSGPGNETGLVCSVSGQ